MSEKFQLFVLSGIVVQRQAPAGRIKLEFNAVHSNHLRVTKKDQALVGKCKAALTLSVQKVGRNTVPTLSVMSDVDSPYVRAGISTTGKGGSVGR